MGAVSQIKDLDNSAKGEYSHGSDGSMPGGSLSVSERCHFWRLKGAVRRFILAIFYFSPLKNRLT